MIHTDSITNALYWTIASDSTIVNCGITVKTEILLNNDPKSMPWIGVYDGDQVAEPHTIGGNQPWKADQELSVYVQTTNTNCSVVATNQMKQIVSMVQSAVTHNLRLSINSVDHVTFLTGMKTSWYKREQEKTQFCFGKILTFNYDVRG